MVVAVDSDMFWLSTIRQKKNRKKFFPNQNNTNKMNKGKCMKSLCWICVYVITKIIVGIVIMLIIIYQVLIAPTLFLISNKPFNSIGFLESVVYTIFKSVFINVCIQLTETIIFVFVGWEAFTRLRRFLGWNMINFGLFACVDLTLSSKSK